jgi:hypothetical protein
MTGYKGRQSAKAIERDFPHIVEMVVPEGGLGKRLDAMYDFHARHGVRARLGLGRRNENGRDIIRWCFAVADAPPIAKDAPAAPNIGNAILRRFRFEACFACAIIEPSYTCRV